MKFLTADLITTYVKCTPQEAVCLVINNQNISAFETDENGSYKGLLLVDLSNNLLKCLSTAFNVFPSAWWFNVSNNQLTRLERTNIPFCMGSLDLSVNNLTTDDLSVFDRCHILRLKIDSNPNINFKGKKTRDAIMAIIPDLWVLNNDYIQTSDSVEKLKAFPLRVREWRVPAVINEKETRLLRALQSAPCGSDEADAFRLDVLLEDYLEETWLFNKYRVIQSLTGKKQKPYVDCTHIMSLSHSLRLDLAVLLTSMIIYAIPSQILNDALLMLLHPHMPVAAIQDLLRLPRFVHTALVCMIHRISKKELIELKLCRRLAVKPRHTLKFGPTESLPWPTYVGPEGFVHLRPLQQYLARSVPGPEGIEMAEGDGAVQPYGELELELLYAIPPTPTLANAPEPSSKSYRDWLSLVARHTVLLLKRCPSCPALTRAQTKKSDQDTYRQLLPLLTAAGMRYQDLELSFTGIGRDGRVQGSVTGCEGGEVMAFGAGIPAGGADNLAWNKIGPMRSYYRPWKQTVEFILNPNSISQITDTKEEFSDTDDPCDVNASKASIEDYPDESNGPSHSLDGVSAVAINGSVRMTHTDSSNDDDSIGSPDLSLHSMGAGAFRAPPLAYFSTESAVMKGQSVSFTAGESEVSRVMGTVEQKAFFMTESDVLHAPSSAYRTLPSVCGFSADANWDPAFILAPSASVDAFNRGLNGGPGQWSSLEFPPVLLTSVDQSEYQTNSKLTMRTGEETGQSEVEGDASIARSFSDDLYSSVAGTSLSAPATVPIPKPDCPDENDSYGKTSAEPSVVGSASHMSESFSRISSAPVEAVKPEEEAGLADSQKSAYYLEAAKKQLLSEMGTLRNVRNLKQYNKELKSKMDTIRQGRGGTSLFGDSLADESSLGELSMESQTQSQLVSWKALLGGQSRAREKSIAPVLLNQGMDAFLTAVELPDEDGDAGPTNKDVQEEAAETSVGPPPAALEDKHMSATRLLRQKFGYDRIFTNSRDVEAGDRSLSGKVLSPTWYPKYGKVMYTIESSAAANLIKKASTLPARGPVDGCRTISPLKNVVCPKFSVQHPLPNKRNPKYAVKVNPRLALMHPIPDNSYSLRKAEFLAQNMSFDRSSAVLAVDSNLSHLREPAGGRVFHHLESSQQDMVVAAGGHEELWSQYLKDHPPSANSSHVKYFRPFGKGSHDDITVTKESTKKLPRTVPLISLKSPFVSRSVSPEDSIAGSSVHNSASVISLGSKMSQDAQILDVDKLLSEYGEQGETSEKLYYNSPDSRKSAAVFSKKSVYPGSDQRLATLALATSDLTPDDSANSSPTFPRSPVGLGAPHLDLPSVPKLRPGSNSYSARFRSKDRNDSLGQDVSLSPDLMNI